MKSLRLLVFFMAVIALSSACSKGGHNPITGDIPNPLNSTQSIDSLPVVSFDGSSAIGLLGAYNLKFSDDLNVELTPIRTPSVGESFVLSGKSFFATRPCIDCLRVGGVALTPTGNVALGFWIKHPFPPGDISQPPSGKNRRDLDLFDIAMVVAPVGATSKTFSQIQTNAYTDAILNADGYTRDLKGVIGDDAALPYKICFENLDKNRFPMGKTDEYFYLLFNKTTVSFDLFLTMAYGASAVLKDRLNPTYYLPEFNRKAAWKVKITSSIWYGADPATITIDIYDWNHGGIVATQYPDPTHLDYLKASSNVAQVLVEVPGMTDNVVTAQTNDTHTNGFSDPLTYTATFSNENGLPEGQYTGLVKIKDSRNPGSGMSGDSVVDSPDGVKLNTYDLDEFATYQTFTAVIAPPCGPITGQVVSPTCPVTGVRDDGTVDFTVTASSANNGNPIVIYEADYDYNGVTFDVDASNTTGVFNDVGPFVNPNCPDPTPVTYTVAFRAKDSCLHPNTTIFATCDVTVDICCGPITGQINTPTCPISGISNNQAIDFTVSASSANGGDPIVKYEADWDYDGTTFDVDSTSTTGSFPNGGPFKNPNCPGSGDPATLTVAFRATDSCNPPNTTIFATCDVTVDICAGWALTWGGTGFDEGRVVKTDSTGNMYVAGNFSGTVDFDPGTSVTEKISNGDTDIFLTKFDDLGVFQWVLTWGGNLTDGVNDLIISPSGDIYITGYFSGTVDFDPTSGIDNKSSVSDSIDVYISRLDISGNYKWTQTWGGNSDDMGTGIALQNPNNLIIIGFFNDAVDFDPGTGTTQFTSAGLSDTFVSTFNNSGVTPSFTRTFTMGSWGYDEPQAVATDSSGNIYLAGYFMGQVDFDPGSGTDTHTSNGGMDIFFGKYDSTSNYVWVHSMGAGGDDLGLDMIVSSSMIYLTGSFQDTVNFDPSGSTEATSHGFGDVFLALYDSDGIFDSLLAWGGTGDDKPYSLSIDDEYLSITGSFKNAVDFDPGAGTDQHTASGTFLDAFASKFQLSDMSFIDALTWGGSKDDEGYSTALDISHNVLVTGLFKDKVDFDPGPFVDQRTSNGDADVFFVNLVF